MAHGRPILTLNSGSASIKFALAPNHLPQAACFDAAYHRQEEASS